MKQPLEQHLTETLEARSTTVRDLPDLGERVVIRGRRVRRRRRMYGGLAVVVAVATAVATPTLLVDRDVRRTPAPPVTTPTGHPSRLPTPEPSSSMVARPWDALPLGPKTNVPFAIWPDIFAGDERIRLRTEDPVEQIHRVTSGYLVQASGFDALAGSVGIVGEEPYRKLVEGSMSGLAVDGDRSRVVWSITDTLTDELRTTLVVAELPTGKRVARHVMDELWQVAGFTEDGVLVSPLADPGGPPSLWDPAAGTVTPLPLPWPTSPASVLALQPGGGLLLLGGHGERCPAAVFTSRPDAPLWEYCDGEIRSAAVSPDGAFVAVYARPRRGPDRAAVVEGASGEVHTRLRLPRGIDLAEVVWEDAEHVLIQAEDETVDDLVSALIRCSIGDPTCERVPTPDDGYITALGRS